MFRILSVSFFTILLSLNCVGALSEDITNDNNVVNSNTNISTVIPKTENNNVVNSNTNISTVISKTENNDLINNLNGMKTRYFYAKVLASVPVEEKLISLGADGIDKKENSLEGGQKMSMRFGIGLKHNIGVSKKFFISPELFGFYMFNPVRMKIAQSFATNDVISEQIKQYKVVKHVVDVPTTTHTLENQYTDFGTINSIVTKNNDGQEVKLTFSDFVVGDSKIASMNFIKHNNLYVQAESVSGHLKKDMDVSPFVREIFGGDVTEEAWIPERYIEFYGEHGEEALKRNYEVHSEEEFIYTNRNIDGYFRLQTIIEYILNNFKLTEEAFEKLGGRVGLIKYDTYQKYEEEFNSSRNNDGNFWPNSSDTIEFSKGTGESKDMEYKEDGYVKSYYDLTGETRYVDNPFNSGVLIQKYTGYTTLYGAFGASLRVGFNLFDDLLSVYAKPSIGVGVFKKGTQSVENGMWDYDHENHDTNWNNKTSMTMVAYDVDSENTKMHYNVMFGFGFGVEMNLTKHIFLLTELNYDFLPFNVKFTKDEKTVTLKGAYNLISFNFGLGLRFGV